VEGFPRYWPRTLHASRPGDPGGRRTAPEPRHRARRTPTELSLGPFSAASAENGPRPPRHGSASNSQLSFGDCAGSAGPGENTAASIPYRNAGSGTSRQLTVSVFELSLPLTAGKTVASVTLPYVGDSIDGVTAVHIFAIGQG
jgi:hypothetical protein